MLDTLLSIDNTKRAAPLRPVRARILIHGAVLRNNNSYDRCDGAFALSLRLGFSGVRADVANPWLCLAVPGGDVFTLPANGPRFEAPGDGQGT